MNETLLTYLENFPQFTALQAKVIEWFGPEGTTLLALVVFAIAAFLVANVMAAIGGLGTYAERKISADIQARQGPNRVGPYGILQFLADGIKMISKEDIAPEDSDKFLFYLAPLLCLIGVFATLAIVPFSSGFALSHLDIGVFFLAAVSSMVGLGIFLGGYASNSKWSLLGGMRGASQIISYEIPVGISALGIVLLAGSLNFQTIISAQTGGFLGWYIFHNPFTFIGFFVFFVGALAETNRAPFDLPEAESELVSGYHTEYTGMRFGFFALAEYIEIFVICGVAAALFLGGYQVPYLASIQAFLKEVSPLPDLAVSNISQLLEVGTFVLKTLALYYVVIWVRWTLPRLRVDQLMTICWKYLTPISLFNLVGIALWAYFFDGHSMWDLIFSGGSHSGGGH